MLAGSVRVCFGDRAEKSSGGHGTHGEQEHPAVPAALCPQREGERSAIPPESRSLTLSFSLYPDVFPRAPRSWEFSRRITSRWLFSNSQAYKADAMEVQLSQLVVERDRVREESQGLQNQLHKAKDRVRTAHGHKAKCRFDRLLCHYYVIHETSPLQVVKIEESLEDVTHQNGCLRSDLLDVQHERDFLKHDVTVLRKQLQNVNEKVRRSHSVFLLPPEAVVSLTLDLAEPRSGEGLVLRRPAESGQEAAQG